jgi:AraC-like DNA-binding protein
MRPTVPSQIRQLESLLIEKFIPWLQNGAPLVLLDTPPRSQIPLEITQEEKSPLPVIPARKIYPHVRSWPVESLNSIDVPVLGCLFDGQADYRVRRPPGEGNTEWTVSLQAGTFFFVPPGVPFTMGRCQSRDNYARAVLIHLRRDCINCFSYTMDPNRIWQTPRFFLYELEVQFLAERLLRELRREGEASPRIASQYTSLILDLMLRSIREKRYTDEHDVVCTLQQPQAASQFDSQLLDGWMQRAEEYILEHLENPTLSCRDIALHIGVSQRHLERLFKQKTGLAPFQFVQQQRLEKARILLMNPGLSIHAVASYCGFRRVSHFSAWFARHQHCSPTTYRKA